MSTLAPVRTTPAKDDQSKAHPEEPKRVHILLSACSCNGGKHFVFFNSEVDAVSHILGIDRKELMEAIIFSSVSGTPKQVGCYTRDIAESKVAQIYKRPGRLALRCCVKFWVEE